MVKDEWSTPQAAIEAAAKEASRRQLRILIGTTANELQAFIQPKNEVDVNTMRRLQYERYDEPDNRFAILAAQGGCPVWKYRFTWEAPESLFGSCHTLELPFVFVTLAAWTRAPMLKGATLEEMRGLSESMQRDWCRFFHTGDFDECDWPRFSESNGIHKIYDNLGNDCQSLRIVKP